MSQLHSVLPYQYQDLVISCSFATMNDVTILGLNGGGLPPGRICLSVHHGLPDFESESLHDRDYKLSGVQPIGLWQKSFQRPSFEEMFENRLAVGVLPMRFEVSLDGYSEVVLFVDDMVIEDGEVFPEAFTIVRALRNEDSDRLVPTVRASYERT